MRKLWKPLLLLAAIAIMGIGMLNTGAWFTDIDNTATGSIKAGTLELKDEGFTTFNIGTIQNMAPGDALPPVTITIENVGTLPLGWFGNLVIGNSALKDVIYIKSATMQFLKPDGTPWEPTDNFIVNGLGYTKNGANTLATLAAFDGNGGMAPGILPDRPEHMGALNPGYKYLLTYEFAFLETAGNEYQGAGPLTISLKVDSMQLNKGALEAFHSTADNHLNWMNQQLDKQPLP